MSGKYKVYVKAVDNKGNITYARTSSFYFDNQAPIISITGDYSSAKQSHSVDISVIDSHSGVKIVTYKWYKEGEVIGDTDYTVWSDYSPANKTLTYNALIDGKYVLAIRTKDNVDILSADQSQYFYFDKTPPQISVTETNGYEFESNRSQYSINITASDSNGDNPDGTIQYIRYRWEDTPDTISISTGWQDVSGSVITYDNGKKTGEKYLHVVARDNSAVGIDANMTYKTYCFIFDWDSPNITVESSNFIGISNTAQVSVRISDVNPIAVAFYAFRDATLGENKAGTDWLNLNVSSGIVDQSVTKSDGTGAFRLHVKARDSQGNEGYYISNKIMLNNEVGTGGINILDEYSNNGTVSLTFNISDDEDISSYSYKISEDGENYSDYLPYVHSTEYTFADTTEGEKTIYVIYRNVYGNETESYTDTVIIDKEPPSAQIVYNPPIAEGFTNSNIVATLTEITDDFSASGSISVSDEFIVFTENGSVDFYITDQAGNKSIITAEVTWIDKQKPVITVSPTSSVTPSQTKDITFEAFKEGQTVSLSYSLVDENDVTILENQYIGSGDFSASGIITLTGEGYQYINITATDGIGNTAQLKCGPYLLDNAPPEASIYYSTENRTANNVVASVSLNEGYVTNNSGLRSFTFEDNGSFTFEFCDEAGNIGWATAEVTWIDRTVPSADISISETETTKNDVQITISVENMERTKIESVTYSNNGMSLISSNTRVPDGLIEPIIYQSIYNVDSNGTLYIYVIDVDTLQESTYTLNINNIDKAPPVCSFHLNERKKTKNDIEVTTICSDLVSNPSTIIPPDNGNVVDLGHGVFKISQNGTYTFTATDSLGNSGTYDLIIDNIDREIYPQITYSNTNPTNQDVVANVFSADEEIYAINNNQNLSYTFKQNGIFAFRVSDSAGNIVETTASVDWINKEGVSVTLVPSANTITNQDVTITIKDKSTINSIESIENLPLAESETFAFVAAQNGVYNFKVTDIYGNIINNSIYIGNIDKTPPVLDYLIEVDTINGRQYLLEGDTLPMTSKPIRIDFSDEEEYKFTIVPEGITIDKKYNIALIVKNGVYNFVAVDTAGNEASKIITIDNFDTTPPKVTISYSTTEPTNKDVIATVTADEEIKIINNFNSAIKVFKENGSFIFTVSDVAGNEVNVNAVVANIDKKPPAVTLTYSTIMPTKENVTVKLSADEPFTVLNNGGQDTYTFTGNNSVYFVVSDIVGNKSTIEAKATNIDKTPPEIIVRSETPILVPINQTDFDFTAYAYVDSYEDSRRPIDVDDRNVDYSTEGIYQITYNVTDAVGNIGSKTKEIEIVDFSKPLLVRFNGLNPGNNTSLNADKLEIQLYNVFDQESIFYLPEKASSSKVKAIGKKLEGRILQIEDSNWYSILVRDKDANLRFYQVFIIKN